MSLMTPEKMQTILEAALMVAGRPLTMNAMQKLFTDDERPENSDIKQALENIRERYADTGVELLEVGSGWRLQAKAELSEWLARLWEDRPPRYSRAFMETLSIIAYKQPVTRAEIEEIRGVTVSTNIIRTLMEREWVRVIGQLDVPGKPSIYGTTKGFLDNFSLKSIKELPTLAEFKELEAQDEKLQVQLAMENSDIGPDNAENIPEERDAIVAEDESNATAKAATDDEQPDATPIPEETPLHIVEDSLAVSEDTTQDTDTNIATHEEANDEATPENHHELEPELATN